MEESIQGSCSGSLQVNEIMETDEEGQKGEEHKDDEKEEELHPQPSPHGSCSGLDGSKSSIFRGWGDLFLPSLTPLIHTREFKDIAPTNNSHDDDADRVIGRGVPFDSEETEARNDEMESAPGSQRRARYVSLSETSASARSPVSPVASSQKRINLPMQPRPMAHFRHLATAVHSHPMHDVDGRKVIVVQSRRCNVAQQDDPQY